MVLAMALLMVVPFAPAPETQAARKKPAAKSVQTKVTKNSFLTPDFAYPRTVDQNARAEYAAAMRSGNGLDALRAAIQLTIAGNLVNRDSVEQSIKMLDEMSARLASPWKELSALVEAQLLAEIYRNGCWEFDNRKLPLEPYPVNVEEWSGDQFAARIRQLVSQASSHGGELSQMPLADIRGLLQDAGDAVNAGMTVQDFIDYKGADILENLGFDNNEPLRFGDKTGLPSPKDQCRTLRNQLLGSAITRNESKANDCLGAFFSKMNLDYISYAPARETYLNACYEKYGDTKWGAPFVADYCRKLQNPENGKQLGRSEQNAARRQCLTILEDYLKKYPTAPDSYSLKIMVSQLLSQNVAYNDMPSNLLPGTAWSLAVTMSGIYDAKLLIYRVPEAIKDNWVAQSKVSALVATVPVKMTGIAPDRMADTVGMPQLPIGRYAIYASTDGTKNGIIKDGGTVTAPVLTVSSMSYFVENGPGEKGRRLYVVDARNQQPLPGVRVTWKEQVYRGTGETRQLVTDKDGCVTLPDKSGDFVITNGSDRLTGNYYAGRYNGAEDTRTIIGGRLLTDLSIYKPGDRMQFVGVVTEQKDKSISALRKGKVTAKLYNTNRQLVDSLNLTTDDFGRVNGVFVIPRGGLLGQYEVRIDKGTETACRAHAQVAEYKSPTFAVSIGKVADSFKPGDVLKIDGRAMTYSGMPVAGGKVDFTVRYMPWRFWWASSDSEAECSGTATVDGDGQFVIELPTENLKDSPYARGRFALSVRVTDAAGETQEAPVKMFSLGSAYEMSVSASSPVCVDTDSVPVKVALTDMTGYPVRKTIYYTLRDKKSGQTVAEGNFECPDFNLDFSRFASGAYELTFSMNADMKSNDECPNSNTDIVLYRSSDKRPPVETALWAPVKTVKMKAGETYAYIPVGSSYNGSWLFVATDNGHKVLKREWVKVSNGIVHLKVNAPTATERVYVHVAGMHDSKAETAQICIIPLAQQQRVEIATESFRDKLEPGSKEQWKFRFSVDGRPLDGRPVMAVMSNKSLNAIAPFKWNLNLWGGLYWPTSVYLNMCPWSRMSESFSRSSRVRNDSERAMTWPELNTYGYSLYSGYSSRNVYYTMNVGAAMLDAEAPVGAESKAISRSLKIRGRSAANSVKEESAYDESVDEESMATGSVSEAVKEPVREIECPQAFFMPDMMTDANGVATLNFDVPQFNGTWQFQIAGYDSQMRGSVLKLDAVASKSVMVQMNAPRFLRTGDKARISATLYNNSGSPLAVGGGMLVTDAGGRVLKSVSEAAAMVDASGQRTVTVEIDVPDNISELQITAYAEGGSHRDAERAQIAVLPSSTPVLESRTFYAGPGEQVIEVGDVALDKKHAGNSGTVTLQYCGNPIWECVTALPAIMTPNSTNILAQVSALYGNAISTGLIKQYPQIAEALKTFADSENAADSTLVSNLQKNQNIKLMALENTPWVNNASDETRRMSQLIAYTDSKSAAEAVAAIMNTLQNRQNNDGGWSWCPDMPTSGYITGQVLLHFAMLKGMGYLPDGAEEMAVKAFRYMDNSLADDWEKAERKYFSTSTLLNYLYVKSFFPNVTNTVRFKPLRAKALKAIKAEWKTFSIYDQATAVTLETRLKETAFAGQILESLRQYASVSADKGMWFANLEGRLSGWNPLITTAQVLEAYGEASPNAPAVDQLRQWLLMSKQTQDWGAMRGTAEVIQAILSTGSDWTAASAPASVTIGGKEVEIPNRARIVDSFTVTLTPEQTAAGDIRIRKTSAGPAWGGVVMQYVAPVTEVREASVPQLRISKNVYAVDGGPVRADELKVGDKVRVTLVIEADRDMDYVAVNDGRSACLEPADQVSGYTSSDGVWYYREVRNDVTNLFIPYLSKGTHVINYECYVDRGGDYTLGIAAAQSQYAPVISAHSAGRMIEVK